MKNDDFGNTLSDRMKMFEAAATDAKLDKTLPVYARLDGRAFHTLTRGMQKPFDPAISHSMECAAEALLEETNADLAYTQSDEISLVWLPLPTDSLSQLMFDGKVHKLTSVLASLCSVEFYRIFLLHHEPKAVTPAFDCRVLNLPTVEEVTNMVLWRVKDAHRNFISSVAVVHFSPSQLHGKSTQERVEMLQEKGIDPFSFSYDKQYGAFFKRQTYQTTIEGEKVTRSYIAKIEPKNYTFSGINQMLTENAYTVITAPNGDTILV